MGTGQKYGSASRARKSPAGCSSVIESLSPRAVIPDTWAAFPLSNASAPTTSDIQYAANDGFSFGQSARSIVRANVSAVTGWFDGGENRYPLLIVNV